MTELKKTIGLFVAPSPFYCPSHEHLAWAAPYLQLLHYTYTALVSTQSCDVGCGPNGLMIIRNPLVS